LGEGKSPDHHQHGPKKVTKSRRVKGRKVLGINCTEKVIMSVNILKAGRGGKIEGQEFK